LAREPVLACFSLSYDRQALMKRNVYLNQRTGSSRGYVFSLFSLKSERTGSFISNSGKQLQKQHATHDQIEALSLVVITSNNIRDAER
jgi:hypothetical protein